MYISSWSPLSVSLTEAVARITVWELSDTTLYVLSNADFLRMDRLCGLVVRVLDYRSRGSGFDSWALQKKSSGSGTGSTQSREYN
jgi:hypothetical protein